MSSTSFDPSFLPKRTKKGRPYSNAHRLWLKGHRIGGKTAWRITSKEFELPSWYSGEKTRSRRLRHHAKYRAGRIWVNFTSDDHVFVRQGDGSKKKYHRLWWLPFLAQVWMSQRFDLWHTYTALVKKYGLRVGRKYGIGYLKWALYGNFEAIKEYVMATKKINLDDYIERHNRVLQWAEGKLDDQNLKPGEQLEAASLAERGLGRMVTVFTEAEKKAKTEDDFENTKNAVLEKIDEVKEELKNRPG